MKNQTTEPVGRRSFLLAVSLCTVSGFAWSASGPARELAITWNSKTIVDFDVALTAVREVRRDNALPGLHLEAKVNGRITDIYIAPMDFLADCEMNFSVGDDVRVIGSLTRLGETDVVLARQISRGRNTLYLRNDEGEPLWSQRAPAA